MQRINFYLKLMRKHKIKIILMIYIIIFILFCVDICSYQYNISRGIFLYSTGLEKSFGFHITRFKGVWIWGILLLSILPIIMLFLMWQKRIRTAIIFLCNVVLHLFVVSILFVAFGDRVDEYGIFTEHHNYQKYESSINEFAICFEEIELFLETDRQVIAYIEGKDGTLRLLEDFSETSTKVEDVIWEDTKLRIVLQTPRDDKESKNVEYSYAELESYFVE